MRLVCPNCDAEYEVDGAAIPDGGRDVQCSACGHAWFQLPPDALSDAEDEAALYDPLPETAPAEPVAEVAEPEVLEPEAPPPPVPVAAVVQPEPDPVFDDETADDAPVADAPEPAARPRSLDENLMAVLKEEAEREAQARRVEADRSAGLETQTELPLAAPPAEPSVGPATAALRKIAKLRGEPEPKPPMPDKADPNRPRRDLLPEIEEINSTLRAASEKRVSDQGVVADTMEVAAPPRSSFRSGFVTMVALLILLAALYIAAPMIAAKVPSLAGVASAYVQAVDTARLALDGLAKTLIAKLTGVTGGQG